MATHTSSTVSASRSFTSRYGNPAEDHRGARMRAQQRHGCTVVSVSGRLDGDNVGDVIAYTLRRTAGGGPVVLDLGGVTAATPNCVRLLRAVDEHCTARGTDWALVAGDAVRRRLGGRDGWLELPLVDSVAHAEHVFDAAVSARRRALLPLLGRTA